MFNFSLLLAILELSESLGATSKPNRRLPAVPSGCGRFSLDFDVVP